MNAHVIAHLAKMDNVIIVLAITVLVQIVIVKSIVSSSEFGFPESLEVT